QDLLDAGRDVGESLPLRTPEVDGVIRVPCRPEGVEKARGERALRGRVKLEMVEIEPEGPVRSGLDELSYLGLEGGRPVRGQAHHLVLPLVHGEPEVRGERRVEHPQGMGEVDFPQQLELRLTSWAPLAKAYGEGCPFPDSVRGQDCRAASRSREGGRGRMRRVVPGEENRSALDAQMVRDDSLQLQLFPQRAPHRSREAAPGARKGAQCAG